MTYNTMKPYHLIFTFICTLGSAALEGKDLANVNPITQRGAELVAADWHSANSKESVLAIRYLLLDIMPGSTGGDFVELADACSRASTGHLILSPSAILYAYAHGHMAKHSPAERMKWLQEHVAPYLESDPYAHVSLGIMAAQCGQDPEPYLKTAAEGKFAEGAVAYASLFCKAEKNDADAMQKWLATAAGRLDGRECPEQLRATLLANLAESCEMKGGVFDALRGPCLAVAFGHSSMADTAQAYLLHDYYARWEPVPWGLCAHYNCMRLIQKTEVTPYVFKLEADIMDRNGLADQAASLLNQAIKAGFDKDKDYRHAFPHMPIPVENDIAWPAMDDYDLAIVLRSMEKALINLEKNGATPGPERCRSLLESLISLNQDRDAVAGYLEKYLMESNPGTACYALYKYHSRRRSIEDRAKATDYLLKAADAGNGDALYELSKLDEPASGERLEKLVRAAEVGCGKAAYELFLCSKLQTWDFEAPQNAHDAALCAALAAGNASAWKYVAENEDKSAAILLARASAATADTDYMADFKTSLTDYAKSHPETESVVQTILMCLP